MEIKEYFVRLHQLPPEEREALFKEIAKQFGPSDERTRDFRARCALAGADVVFYSRGITPDEALRIVESPETRAIIEGVIGPRPRPILVGVPPEEAALFLRSPIVQAMLCDP